MSSRSRQAQGLARGLWTYWRLPTGVVQVVWAQDWRGGQWRWGYRVEWTDGPTVGHMRHAARTAVFAGLQIDELVAGDLVCYQRSLSPLAWAVTLIEHLGDGGAVPDLAQPAVAERWQAELAAREFPERARTRSNRRSPGGWSSTPAAPTSRRWSSGTAPSRGASERRRSRRLRSCWAAPPLPGAWKACGGCHAWTGGCWSTGHRGWAADPGRWERRGGTPGGA
jgi:hypothetical protein